jgi:hypothetical protein
MMIKFCNKNECEYLTNAKNESAWELFRRLTENAEFNKNLCAYFKMGDTWGAIETAVIELQKTPEPEAIAIMQQIEAELEA